MGEYVNSKQVRFDKSHVSCAIVEAHHLPSQSPKQTLFSIANHLYNKSAPRPAAFVLFSDIIPEDGTRSRGQALALEILNNKSKIGDLITTPNEVNPKTGNVVKVWLLHVKHENFRKWYQDELANALAVE